MLCHLAVLHLPKQNQTDMHKIHSKIRQQKESLCRKEPPFTECVGWKWNGIKLEWTMCSCASDFPLVYIYLWFEWAGAHCFCELRTRTYGQTETDIPSLFYVKIVCNNLVWNVPGALNRAALSVQRLYQVWKYPVSEPIGDLLFNPALFHPSPHMGLLPDWSMSTKTRNFWY